jgi:hypothetical protein
VLVGTDATKPGVVIVRGPYGKYGQGERGPYGKYGQGERGDPAQRRDRHP